MTTLNEKILNQVEFYFSDSNFRKDKFMQTTAKANAEGFIPIETLLTFNRLKALTTDAKVVAEAMKESSTVQISEDGTKLKRSAELPQNDDSAARTLYVKGYPAEDAEVGIEFISKQFGEYGKVCMVTLRRNAGKQFKGSCFIEYSTEKSVADAVEAANKEGAVQIGHKDTKFDCVMPYVEWLKRKEIKRSKALQKIAEKAQNKKEAQEAAKKSEIENVQYTSGLILKVNGVPADISLFELKDFFKKLGNVSFVDFEGASSAGVAHVRVSDVESSTKIQAALKEGKSAREGDAKLEFSVLEGEEEKTYWQKIASASQNRNKGGHNNKRKGGRGFGGSNKKRRN